MTGDGRWFRPGVYAGLALAVLVVILASRHGTGLSEVLPKVSNPSDLQAKAIDLYAENARALSSYVMLVLTGVGFFVHLVFSNSGTQVTPVGKVLLIGTVVACSVSLLAGYFCYDRIIEILGNGLAFDPSASRIVFFHRVQFWCFLASVAIFGIFGIEALLS